MTQGSKKCDLREQDPFIPEEGRGVGEESVAGHFDPIGLAGLKYRLRVIRLKVKRVGGWDH